MNPLPFITPFSGPPFVHEGGLEQRTRRESVPSDTHEPEYAVVNYREDAIPHETIDEPNAGFFGYITRGASHYVINRGVADRPDKAADTGIHERTHYFFPNYHMDGATGESWTLLMSGTVYSEQPRGSATFQMRDLDIGRAYANEQRNRLY